MRSIYFDELLNPEVDAVRDYLEREAVNSGVDGLYWIFLPQDLWSEAQHEAQREAGWSEGEGYRLAVEVGSEWVRFELLVRSESLLNLGGGQADERQALYVLRWADKMALSLNLPSCSGCHGSMRPGGGIEND